MSSGHRFQVFDFEDNCFRRLTSVEQPIKYLSRIRVLPKNSNNGQTFSAKQKTIKQRFDNYFFDDKEVNDFNVGEEVGSPVVVPPPQPKRPIGPDQYYHSFKRDREEWRRVYDPYFNQSGGMYLNGGYGYGGDGFEYGYSGPPAPMGRLYMRRSDLMQPIPGPSFADPYDRRTQPYCRRGDFYSDPYGCPPPDDYYSPYNGPPSGPTFGSQMPFRRDVNPRYGFGSDFSMNFRQNLRQKKPRFGDKRLNKGVMIRNQRREEQRMAAEMASNADTGVLPINMTYGYTMEPIDKLLLVKPNKSGPEVEIVRRNQLRKISTEEKKRFYRHGIRLKDGSGFNAFICVRCCVSLSSLDYSRQHLSKFFEINKSINYPKDYNTLDDNNNLPKVELRYRRILNALELTLDKNKSNEELNQLMQLRDEGIVFKETIDGSNVRYYSCLVCDIRFDTVPEAKTHSHSEEHVKNRSPKRFKGLDKALLMDSEKCGQIEVVLARKQELEKIKFFTKEQNFEHGIRLKDGIGPEAYYCFKCDQWFDSSEAVRLHVEKYEKKLINESSEESLIDSTKKQMELLSKEKSMTEDTKEEVNEEMNEEKIDLNAEEVEKTDLLSKEGNPVAEDIKEAEQMDSTADEDNTTEETTETPMNTEETDQLFKKEGIKSMTGEESKGFPFYDCICDIRFKDKDQVLEHLSGTFHFREKSGEFFKPMDKAFCVSTDRIEEAEVALARLQILERLSDEVKQKFTKEGIRLKDGIGREAFWCVLCEDSIISPNVESGSYSFINHINYNPKHVELLISQMR